MGCLELEAGSWSLDIHGPDERIPDFGRIRDALDQVRRIRQRQPLSDSVPRMLMRTRNEMVLAFGLPTLSVMQQNFLQSLVVAVKHLVLQPTDGQLSGIRLGVAHLAARQPITPATCADLRASLRTQRCVVDELGAELNALPCFEVEDRHES